MCIRDREGAGLTRHGNHQGLDLVEWNVHLGEERARRLDSLHRIVELSRLDIHDMSRAGVSANR